MKGLLSLLGLSLWLTLPVASALTMALVEKQIEIDVGYSGAKITVFATSDLLKRTDSVFKLILAGPQSSHRVTMKQGGRIEHFDFISAPMTWFLASEPLTGTTLPAQTLKDHGLDMQMLARPAPDHLRDPHLPHWRAVFTRLKRDSGLFAESGTITRLGKTLLRADFILPARAPAGLYQVRALAFADGKLQARSDSALELRREGLENWLFDLAHDNAMLYGILAVVTGLLVGAGGALIGRR